MTYPRTDGRCVSSEKAKEFSSLLKTISVVPELNSLISVIKPSDIKAAQASKRTVNDAEVAKSSHDALLPTASHPDISALSADERNIYLMICKRFIAQFYPAEINELTTMIIDIDGNPFRSNGKVCISEGWNKVFETKKTDTVLPDLKKGDTVKVSSYETVEYTTHPPARLTQATLINAMVNINKYIEDKGLKM